MDWLNINIHFPITDPTWIFLLVLIIILFAPILLSRLRIPHIIGLIISGIIVGEYGFNILERDSSFELFGKVGLYYIMFLAGLEMDLEDFKKNRMKALVFGLFTFIIPMVLGVWSSMSLLEYSFTTSVLLASMYASHTLIAYPIVSRYGLSRIRSVSITIGGTAITVALALLVLAVISGMNKGEVNEWFWVWLAIKVIGVCFLIIFFFPRIGRWFFRHYEDNIMQFIFVLVMVFLGGAILELVGMEGILGAFLVGLVLNRLIPNLSPLMNRLEFVGNALFIPYFLIGVGMIIDIRALFTGGEALKVAVVMTIVATFSKWLAAWLTQKSFRMRATERELIFGLSNAQAAATLAAVLVGNKIEVSPGVPLLNDDVLNGTVVMILFTCIISSIATERAARKMTVEDDTGATDEKPKEQENILIPIANPDTIENLINMALLMKEPRRKDGLTALSVINDSNASEARLIQGKRALERSAMVAAAADVNVHTVTRFDMNVASGIIHAMKECAASEVVIGLHHKVTLVDSFLGTLTENLLKGTHKQVMIVKNLIPVNTLRRIIVAVPAKAEYEIGFFKWVERVCRMGLQLGCRVHFYANKDTLRYLEGFINKKYKGVRREFTELEEWEDLLLLTGQVNYDHLLIIASARRGFISYDPSFEKLPSQITKYFNNCSLIVLYPDQYGDPQETLSFSEPLHHNESHHYDSIGKWLYKWFKKG
ncbi:cation:proton antiporter [Bacteroides sp. 224]|uniref:cation:proton antiporter n=1 Tax=Bacteroides sp. 224 TaxID=2302936 RepID=UPI0013D3D9D9|nr:cation:proton antiporter [Bacteroides sp. 224]NDV64181.1 cation:proton antiporter [Bacteroides sp. 224]